MARARRKRRRGRRPASRRSTTAPRASTSARAAPRRGSAATLPPATTPPPPLVDLAEAERRLLALARELEGWGADALPRAVRALAGAYAPDAELPRAVHRAWLASRDDKTAALALAWAREQLRLALQSVIEATPPSARGTLGLSADTLAWLLLSTSEALAHEPPSAAPDRVRVLLQLIGHTGAAD